MKKSLILSAVLGVLTFSSTRAVRADEPKQLELKDDTFKVEDLKNNTTQTTVNITSNDGKLLETHTLLRIPGPGDFYADKYIETLPAEQRRGLHKNIGKMDNFNIKQFAVGFDAKNHVGGADADTYTVPFSARVRYGGSNGTMQIYGYLRVTIPTACVLDADKKISCAGTLPGVYSFYVGGDDYDRLRDAITLAMPGLISQTQNAIVKGVKAAAARKPTEKPAPKAATPAARGFRPLVV